MEEKKVRVMHIIAHNVVDEFQKQLDEFCSKYNVVEKHFTCTPIITHVSEPVKIPGFQQAAPQAQTTLIPSCILFFECTEVEAHNFRFRRNNNVPLKN